MRKVAILGGGGVRTPLVVYGMAQSQAVLDVGELVLFDIDKKRVEAIARLCREVLRNFGIPFQIRTASRIEEAAEGADFVLNSIRVGGIPARARDERIAIEHGLAGQETTGPGGAAMALRTLPVTLAHARIIESIAPLAWFINFTNPAGLITQALTQYTNLNVVGICDTPMELFHRIATAIGEPYADMRFDYAGLNHLGWVRRVLLRDEDITDRILDDTNLLRGIYPAALFDPSLIQTLRLIPTEYLFFYYSQNRAYRNQLQAGSSRGAELEQLNAELFRQIGSEASSQALVTYRDYLKRRNASYLKLEAQAGSAFSDFEEESDPFELQTGYHRIALDVMTGLLSNHSLEVVVNVPNHGAIDDLQANDVVEVPCDLDRQGVHRRSAGRLPESVLGLVQSVKSYERTIIKAAFSGSFSLARLAMLEYPDRWRLGGGFRCTPCAVREGFGALRLPQVALRVSIQAFAWV